MNARALMVFQRAAEAAFPPGTAAPSYQEAAVVSRFLEWRADLPSPQRRLVTLLLIATEVSSFLLTGRSYGRLSEARRLALVARLRRHRIYALRLIGDSLKGILTMIYLASPPVAAHLGMIDPADPGAVIARRAALRVLDEVDHA